MHSTGECEEFYRIEIEQKAHSVTIQILPIFKFIANPLYFSNPQSVTSENNLFQHYVEDLNIMNFSCSEIEKISYPNHIKKVFSVIISADNICG